MSVPVVLIPGAGGQAWVWHLVEADLRQRGYDAFAVDLPAADESKGLPAYADAVVSAVGDRANGDTPVTIAAYSLGAFTAPLVWQRVPARQVIFVNAMIPRPGETPGAWWDDVGWEQARTTAARRNGYSPDFDLDTYFLHDIPADLRQLMLGHDVPQSPGPFGDICLSTGGRTSAARHRRPATTGSSRSTCSSGSPGSGSASSPMWCPAGTSPR